MSAQLITLVATDENGRTGFAHYWKEGEQWKFKRSSPILDFLRFCGQLQDAAIALKRRGFIWSWTHRREQKDRFESQGYGRFKPGRYRHAARRASKHFSGAMK